MPELRLLPLMQSTVSGKEPSVAAPRLVHIIPPKTYFQEDWTHHATQNILPGRMGTAAPHLYNSTNFHHHWLWPSLEGCVGSLMLTDGSMQGSRGYHAGFLVLANSITTTCSALRQPELRKTPRFLPGDSGQESTNATSKAVCILQDVQCMHTSLEGMQLHAPCGLLLAQCAHMLEPQNRQSTATNKHKQWLTII
eukprot:1138319-Pelagomonas_calceolata.AAC.1